MPLHAASTSYPLNKKLYAVDMLLFLGETETKISLDNISTKL
jgi:hypothetical protein